jgi:hypothetical protein
MTQFAVSGLTDKQGAHLAELPQKQVSTYNGGGPNFIGVHEMIDPQVDAIGRPRHRAGAAHEGSFRERDAASTARNR